ncbi:hypothetical protein [Chryseobacterium polytrichastri]|uniref:DUF8202 domain-containing protein n=1 Tax=Chryseobacterium polytrichastri TaxID=1302687 RepID=A0A1M6XPG9_9FLAO|nr:hypothetical protein [Chryseobacterium polytrichastri]SHL07877.1 hypothetical protein SAMN05444267_101179 [Chryseobacterium polytrichastri]
MIHEYFLKIISFALICIIVPIFGQSPGGVVPAAWYKADASGTLFSDAGVTSSANNSTVYQWNDAQGNGFNLLQASAGLRPTFSNSTTLANFNPTVTFQSKWMEFQPGTGVNIIDRTNGTLFTAGYMNVLNNCGIFGFDSTMDYPGLHTSNNGLNNLLFFTGGPGYQGVTSNSFQNNFYFTAGANWQNGAGTNASYAAATVSLNGNRTDYSGSQLQNAVLDVNARDIRVGGDTNYGSMNGQVNEMLIFENRLTADEMDRVESYLSIKYGTTYAQGTKDYKSSSSAVVWNASGNTGYNNNIAGIGRDNMSALHQKQSRSINNIQKLIIGNGNSLSDTNALNSNSLTDGQYLIWGDNGLRQNPSVALANPVAPGGGTNYRFASIWKVQNTGSVGTVTIAWPSTGFENLHLVRSTDATIDATDTFVPMTGTTTVNGITYNTATVTLANGNYFTFAAYVHAPGGVLSSLWYRADKGLIPATGAVTTWTDYSAGQVPVIPALSSTTSAPSSVDGIGLNFNFNPGVTFVAANALGNSSVLNAVSSTNYSIYTSTTPVTGSGYDRVVGLNYSTLTGGNKYDSPGIAAVNINMRDNGAGSHINAAVTPVAAQYTQLSNTSIVRNSFTNNQFQRALNGAAVISNMAMTALTTWPDVGIVLGRNANDGGDDNGSGMTMSETIVFDGTLSANDINKVDSYLAIKGGITLDVTNTPNYLSSSSTNVWSGSVNTGYNNNIFGIANDFVSTLHQKQSKSINAGQKLIIGAGSTLANTNALNTNSLANGQFLIVGDNGLKQNLTTPISGITGVNYRFESIWKAQNTGGVGTVRIAWPEGLTAIRLIQSSDAVFDATDTATNMSVNTQIVNGVTYNYADVTLANGQYFTFAGFTQAPGGVVGPDFWVKSDDSGAIATAWKDNSPNADNIPNVGGVTLSPADRSHNFYPYTTGYTASKFFYNSASVMNPLGNVELPNTNTSVFSAVRPTSVNATGRITGIDDDATFAAEPAFSIANGKPRQYEFFATTTSSDFSTAFNVGQSNVFSALANNTIANGGTSSIAGGEKRLGLNGTYESFSGFAAANRFQIYGRNLRIGQAGWDAGGAFAGDIMEIAWYNRTLTGNEQSRVNSYLAVKNGVTLNENYLSTASTVVWDKTGNVGYSNNIFGIAKDDFTALHQKQAGSVNNGQQLVISTTGFANSNASNNIGLANDQQFLMVGDNGLKQSLTVPISGITGVNYRFESIWKAQNTGSVGIVRIAWPAGLESMRLIQSTDTVIDNTDTVTDMSVNTQAVNGVTYNYADVALANGQYFTFAAFAHAPGGVINGLSQWYRADIDATNTGNTTDVTSWKDYFGGTIVTQMPAVALPKYKTGAAAYFNFNPGINFTAITQALGNNTVQTITNTNNDIFTVTKEGMTSAGSPTPHFFSITENNATTTIASWDYTGFWPVSATIERRVVGGGTQFVNSNINFATGIPSIMYNTFTASTLARGLNGAANGATANNTAVGLALGGHVFGDTRFTGSGSDNGGIVGDIGETIIYGGGNITAAERRKVDTYLAIKYGITLGRVATDNYVSSENAAIWNGALNTTYNNNVFGLAKDDISSLHQKVSKSVNAGTILMMATNNDFVSQNIAASRALLSGDQKYFLTGDNTVTATPLVGVTISGNPAQRIQRIWLSQRTSTLGNVYFAANLTAYGTGFAPGNNIRMFVADDAAFTVNVQSIAGTYSGNQWVFNKSFDTDATARYITFGSELQPQVLWVKADKGVNTASGVPADNTQITTWYDQEIVNGAQDGSTPTTDPGELGEVLLPTLPFYKYNTTDNFNFNPVVNFSNTGRGNAVQFTTPTLGSQTIISVFKAAGFGSSFYNNMLLYGGDVSNPSAGDPAPLRADMSFGVSAGSFLSFGGGSAGDYSYLGNLGLQTQTSIGTLKRNRIGDEEIYYSTYGNGSNDILNQNADPTNTRTGEGRLLSGLVRIGKHFSATTTLNAPDGRLDGSYAELIVYDKVLSDSERAIVESYLAVKYGITLTGGTDQLGGTLGNLNYPYVSSAGTVIRASDLTYKYDVFGLGRDDYYGLNQRISKSNNAGDILTVSMNNDFTSLNLNAARTTIDGDQEFMLFANNKGSGSAVVEQTTELPANVGRRLDREWKVAQANTDGTDISNISLKFNLAGVTLTGANATNVMLLVDSDGDGDFTTGAVQVIPASTYTAGSAVSFNNIVLTGGQVFTLGIAQGLCYKPGAVAGAGNPSLPGKIGITSLTRTTAESTTDNWPAVRTGAWMVLEAKTKGFVVNRLTFNASGNPVGIPPANFVEGMLLYDTTNKCLKMYTSQDGGTSFAWYCVATQTCPD